MQTEFSVNKDTKNTIKEPTCPISRQTHRIVDLCICQNITRATKLHQTTTLYAKQINNFQGGALGPIVCSGCISYPQHPGGCPLQNQVLDPPMERMSKEAAHLSPWNWQGPSLTENTEYFKKLNQLHFCNVTGLLRWFLEPEILIMQVNIGLQSFYTSWLTTQLWLAPSNFKVLVPQDYAEDLLCLG